MTQPDAILVIVALLLIAGGLILGQVAVMLATSLPSGDVQDDE